MTQNGKSGGGAPARMAGLGLSESGGHGHGPLAVAPGERTRTFKHVAVETGPRLANVAGKGRLSLTDFLPEV